MKYTFWGFGLIMSGLFGLFFIVMFENITVNNESEYYTLKEAVEAAEEEERQLQTERENTEANKESVGVLHKIKEALIGKDEDNKKGGIFNWLKEN